jgi:hypothetical protein
MRAARAELAPSWRVVRLAHDPTVEPAASWERLAVWCALRELPVPTAATRVTFARYDPAALGAARLEAVGCRVGPGVTGAGEFTVLDTPAGLCAVGDAADGPRALAEAPPPGVALVGLAHWVVDGRCYWPVRSTPRA